MHIHEIEEIEYEEGARYTAWLIARRESLEAGLEGDGSDHDAVIQAELEGIYRQLYPGDYS